MSDFVILWTVAHQAPLSMGFSRQENWSGSPCSSPGDLPHSGIKPASLASPALASGLFPTEPPGKPNTVAADGKFSRKAMNKGYVSPRGGFNDNQARHVLIIDIYLFIMHR